LKYAISLSIVLAAVWLAWSGIFQTLTLSLGLASVIFVVFVAHRMGLTDAEGAPFTAIPRSLTYAPWLAKEIVLANLDVARRILSPSMPIAPRMIRITAHESTDLARVIYANSITLTPGTVTVEVEGEEFTVHALTPEAAEALEHGEMDLRVARIDGKR
jgi:multicomponent Na+:H+ antiporter subunit E